MAIFAALMLASLSGSAIADSAALAAIFVPMLRKAGYEIGRSTGLMAAGGITAPVIPPSIAFVIYGSIANVSIRDLFLAGIVPGLLMAIALVIAWRIVARNDDVETLERKGWSERGVTLLRGAPALLLPVVVIGGLRMGYVTPTEAAVIAAAFATLIGAVIYQELTLVKFYKCLVNAARASAAVMFLIGASGVSAWLIATANLPSQLVTMIEPLVAYPMLLLAVIVLLTLFLGMVLDFAPLMLILMPILIPVCKVAGIDLVYFVLFL